MNKIIDVKQEATPFVKWAGGKRQLLSQIEKRLPPKFNTYIEPFVGGGAVFFYLQPKKAVINDLNEALINVYVQIRDHVEELIGAIIPLDEKINQDKQEFYYKARELYNTKLLTHTYDIETAALFIFLNKHCFNGLYRLNRKGLFNVPYNRSVRPSYVKENLFCVSSQLQAVKITCGDFEGICQKAKSGDFLFLDSPYAPIKEDSFEAYTKEGFAEEEHRRLERVFRELTDKGCYCMLTNHDTPLIRELYGQFNYEVVPVKRMINSKADKRTGFEVIVRNYE